MESYNVSLWALAGPAGGIWRDLQGVWGGTRSLGDLPMSPYCGSIGVVFVASKR